MNDLPIDGDFFESLGTLNDVFYCKTDNVAYYLENSDYHKILITHNSDQSITKELYDTFIRNNKFSYWLAQNISINADRLLAIPIGLERARWCNFNKYDVMMKCKKEFENKNPEKVLYANFSLNTNSVKRHQCISSFIGKKFLTNKVENSITNVKELTIDQYKNYCNDILNHQYVLCPEGNGIDTHRFWEVLYLGRIPVVLHNPVNDSFNDMPVLILDQWEDFEKYSEFNYSLYSLQKLHRSYYVNLINNLKHKIKC